MAHPELTEPGVTCLLLRTLLMAGLLAAGPAAAQGGGACADPVPEDEWSVLAPLATRSLMLDLARVGDVLVAVGDRGHVVISEDHGRTWTQQRTPTRSLLTGVWFHDRNLGWAVGHDAVILRTEDGGASWCRVHWAPEQEQPLLDVWFETAEHGIAVGAYGYLLRTTDGGRTWAEETLELVAAGADDPLAGENGRPGDDGPAADDGADDETDEESEEEWDEDFNLGGDFHLNKIVVAGGGDLYLAAEAGTLYRSSDAGRTWEQLASPYDGSFFSGLAGEDGPVMMFGLRGNAFTSSDEGDSWQPVEMPADASLFGGARLNDGSIVLVGASGVMLIGRGADGYRLVQRDDRKVLVTLLEAADGGVVVVGEPGVLRLERAFLAAD